MYTVKTTSNQAHSLYAGTDGVVKIKHCRREMDADYWHIIFIGKLGQAAGIYTYAPGEPPTKRLVAYVAEIAQLSGKK